jgi:hypothetical protein
MIYSIQSRKRVFLLLRISLSIAALYHLTGIFYKVNDATVLRHAVFVALDSFCVYGFFKRPRYFVFCFAAFTLHQYVNHGTYLINVWIGKHEIHWISVFVLALIPAGLVCLIDEYFQSFSSKQ